MDNRKYERESAAALQQEQQESARRLREFPTFEKFSDDDLKRLVQAAHRTSTSGPWPLIREQTPSDACYILLSGEAGCTSDKSASRWSGRARSSANPHFATEAAQRHRDDDRPGPRCCISNATTSNA